MVETYIVHLVVKKDAKDVISSLYLNYSRQNFISLRILKLSILEMPQ